MRFFILHNFQHVVLYVFPTLIFILVFASALGFYHVKTSKSANRKQKIIYRFADDISDRNAPFPLAMILIILGTVAWMMLYILGIGIFGVKI